MSIYLGTVKMSGSAGIAGGDASVVASNIILSTTAQPYITVNNSSKTIVLPETDPYDTARTPTSHTHGQITNDGKITSTSVSLSSGDSLVFIDSSDSSKIKKTSITFDGSTTTKYLSQAGTWVSVPSQTTVSYSPTVTSSTTGSYVIGTLTVNGTNTTIYGKDTTSSGGGGSGSSYDFNNTSLAYSSTYSEQGLSSYYADCTSAKRNVMLLNIDSSVYSLYFSHDESLGIYLKTTDLTENYVFIHNNSGYDITANYEVWDFITASNEPESISRLTQIDSSGNYITIPNLKTTMLGISRMQMGNEVFMLITYGGTFSYT